MKVLTPEIAWHETLPIYSCDLQPFNPSSSHCHDVEKARLALAELDPADFPSEEELKEPVEATKLEIGQKKKADNPNETDFGETWTRLATAGGDSVVRLWRVNLDWMPPSSVTTFRKSLSSGVLKKADAAPGPSSSAAANNTPKEGLKVSAPISEGLVFLATLKRHERLVNVVRWSPSGNNFTFSMDSISTFNLLFISILKTHRNDCIACIVC